MRKRLLSYVLINKYRQRIISAVTGSMGLSLVILSAVIATTKIEDREGTSNAET